VSRGAHLARSPSGASRWHDRTGEPAGHRAVHRGAALRRRASDHPASSSLGVMLAAAAAGVVITIGEFFANLLNAGPSGFGVLVAAVGLGMVVGLLAAAPLSRRLRPEWLFGPGLVVAGSGSSSPRSHADLAVAIPPAVLMGSGAGSCSSSATRSCSSARTIASAAAPSPRSTPASGLHLRRDDRRAVRHRRHRSRAAHRPVVDGSPSSSTPTCSAASVSTLLAAGLAHRRGRPRRRSLRSPLRCGEARRAADRRRRRDGRGRCGPGGLAAGTLHRLRGR
jgi:hypothetical protein